jgi:hypothetical protein
MVRAQKRRNERQQEQRRGQPVRTAAVAAASTHIEPREHETDDNQDNGRDAGTERRQTVSRN